MDMDNMIEFKDGQDKISFSKNKITKSVYENHLDIHLVYSIDETSGYSGKFVRIITVENIYEFDVIKFIRSSNCNEMIPNILYFENGGYLYDKKTF